MHREIYCNKSGQILDALCLQNPRPFQKQPLSQGLSWGSHRYMESESSFLGYFSQNGLWNSRVCHSVLPHSRCWLPLSRLAGLRADQRIHQGAIEERIVHHPGSRPAWQEQPRTQVLLQLMQRYRKPTCKDPFDLPGYTKTQAYIGEVRRCQIGRGVRLQIRSTNRRYSAASCAWATSRSTLHRAQVRLQS